MWNHLNSTPFIRKDIVINCSNSLTRQCGGRVMCYRLFTPAPVSPRGHEIKATPWHDLGKLARLVVHNHNGRLSCQSPNNAWSVCHPNWFVNLSFSVWTSVFVENSIGHSPRYQSKFSLHSFSVTLYCRVSSVGYGLFYLNYPRDKKN